MRLTLMVIAFLALYNAAQAGEDTFIFMMPSKNIACQFNLDINENVYCVRRDAAASTMDVPVLNAFVQLGKGEATTGPFSGDVWYPDGAQILAYGKSMTHVGITCTSKRTGLTCKNKQHGFTVNSKKISVY
jgi:hypothetical protein